MAPIWSGVRLAAVGVAEGLGASMRPILALGVGNTTARRCANFGFGALAAVRAGERSLRAARMHLPRRGWRKAAGWGHIAGVSLPEETMMWPDRRLMDLFKIEHPIVLAPM